MPSIELIEQVIAEEKENCQRKVNQGVLKEDRVQQLMYLGGIEALDRLFSSLKLAANVQRIAESKPQKLRVLKARGK